MHFPFNNSKHNDSTTMGAFHLAPTGTRHHISSGSDFEAEIGYSRAVISDDWVFVSGTTGYDYKTGAISNDVVEQAEQTFRNVNQALVEAGSDIRDIVRVRYILPNREDFPKVWPVIKHWFAEVSPAATFQVGGLFREEMKIEIEVTARKDSHKPKVY